MTIICYRDGVMAADTAAIADGIRQSSSFKIIRSQHGVLAACAGSSADCYKFERWFQDGSDPFRFKISLEEEGSFGGIFVLSDGQVHRVTYKGDIYPVYAKFHAEGSAYQFALGALAAGCSAEETVKLCIEHCQGVGGPVQIEVLRRP